MNECSKCKTVENIVYSGTDAVMLGVIDLVERICYDCAKSNKRVLHLYKDEYYRTELVEYELGVWEVLTWCHDSQDYEDLVNNTGTIDNYPEAESEFCLHLDLYYQKTLEEVTQNV